MSNIIFEFQLQFGEKVSVVVNKQYNMKQLYSKIQKTLFPNNSSKIHYIFVYSDEHNKTKTLPKKGSMTLEEFISKNDEFFVNQSLEPHLYRTYKVYLIDNVLIYDLEKPRMTTIQTFIDIISSYLTFTPTEDINRWEM